MTDEQIELLARNRKLMYGYMEADEDFPSDEELKLTSPELTRSFPDAPRIELPRDFTPVLTTTNILDVIGQRRSRRVFSAAPVSLTALAWALYSAQGVQKVIGRAKKARIGTVPSAGARNPLDIYLFVHSVETLTPGLYHYQPIDHVLEYLGASPASSALSHALCGQEFAANAPVTLVFTCTPYRTEWRYTTSAAKYALIDAGHACENLYLAAEAASLSVCAIGAYMQKSLDALLPTTTGEFSVYAAAMGGRREEER